MKKALIAATAAALIAGSAATYAANTGPGPGRGERWQPSAADFAALTDARIAGLKAGLKLTPDQEKLWPQVETTLRDVAKDRAARMEQAREARKAADGARPDPITRMRNAATRMDAAAADLRKVADASQPLYNALDEAQKQRLNVLLRQNFKGMGIHHGGPYGGPRRG